MDGNLLEMTAPIERIHIVTTPTEQRMNNGRTTGKRRAILWQRRDMRLLCAFLLYFRISLYGAKEHAELPIHRV